MQDEDLEPIRPKLLSSVTLLVANCANKPEIAACAQITLPELDRRLQPGVDKALTAAWENGLERMKQTALSTVLNISQTSENDALRLNAAKYILDNMFGYSSASRTYVKDETVMPTLQNEPK